MMGLIYQLGGSRFGMGLLESIFAPLFFLVITGYIGGLMTEESQFSKRGMNLIALRSMVPTFAIVWFLRLFYDTFFINLRAKDFFNYTPFSNALFMAIAASIYFPLFNLFSKNYGGFQSFGKNTEENRNKMHLDKYKKSFMIILILFWAVALIALIISLMNKSILYLYLGLFYAFITVLILNALVIIFNASLPMEGIPKDRYLEKWKSKSIIVFLVFWSVDLVVCLCLFVYGIINPIWYLWLIAVIGLVFVPRFAKRLGIVPKKIPAKALKNARAFASIVSYGIWTIQLVFFDLILPFLNIVQDLRLNIIICYAIFICTFIFILRKKYIPLEFEKKIAKLRNSIAYEENEKKLGNKILDVKDLVTYFYTEEGTVRAVEGVSFQIYEGEVLGLVGETGCGKSVSALSIMQLVPYPGEIKKGEVIYRGEDLLQKTKDQILTYRGNRITMCFQDPLNSINPVYKVGDQISEVYLLHQQPQLFKAVEEYARKNEEHEKLISQYDKQIESVQNIGQKYPINPESGERITIDDLIERRDELIRKKLGFEKYNSIYSVAHTWCIDLLGEVGIPDPEQIYNRYPYELSGGMRQRIGISMAIACNPDILIADEPTTALDVTVQNQILKLFKDLRKKRNTSMLFITHDLGIISKMCDRVAVMYSGYIVEYGAIITLFETPYHPYTKALISSIPNIKKKRRRLTIIPGTVPNLIYPPLGCRFHPRCAYCFEPCETELPKAIEVEPNYKVACHLYDPKYKDLADMKIKEIS